MRSSLSVALSLGLLLAQQPPPPAPAPAPQTVGGLNLNGASLLSTIELLARELHINYILDSSVKGGTVTINTYGEVKATDLRPIFETILRMNGLAMVQVGNIYRILPSAQAPRTPISPQVNQKELPDDERMILNVIFLKFMAESEMENILKPFLGESATMVPYPPANVLIIQDNSRNMKRTMELIDLFDSDKFAGQRVQTFTTQNSRPTDVAKELDTIFKAYALSDKGSPVKFLAIDRINTVLAVASNPGVFKDVGEWVQKLDVPAKLPAGAVSNYVYKLKYGRAEVLGSVIMQLYGGTGFSALSSPFGQAGMRYNNQGYNGGSNPLNNFPSGGIGSPFGATNPYPGNNTYPQNPTNTSPTSPIAGPFGGVAPPTGGAGAAPGAAAGTTGPTGSTDQTGQYLTSSGVTASGGLPRIVPNPFDNTLLVQGTPQMWEQILRLLEQLDIPPRQVLIDAKIFEVDLSDALSSGVEEFLNRRGDFSGGYPTNTRQILGALNNGVGISLSAGTLVGHSRQLLVALTASDLKSKAKVLSAPSVIATDSIPASINVGTDVPTLAAQAVAPGLTAGGTSQFTQSVQNTSTGVSLNILARVNSSGIVTMVIDQSVSAPTQNTLSNIDSPAFSKRDVSTQVTVQDGDTIAIGGIIQETESLASNGIPGLHRIPYVGTLFGSKSYSKARTELIIFLTPRVIYDTNQISEATEELRQKVKSLDKMTRKDQ